VKKHVIQINADNQPTTLEQLLRVVRYRGFKLDNIKMQASLEEEFIEVLIKVQSARRIELLINQLTKLVDIKSVTVMSSRHQRLYAN
jgi:acetolactate synthase II small subunit